jgi:hypothetical protein
MGRCPVKSVLMSSLSKWKRGVLVSRRPTGVISWGKELRHGSVPPKVPPGFWAGR